jgi:nucleoside-triphosphatase THEP1
MMNTILTGPVHIGKTTVCRAVADLALGRGYCVRGILTPPILKQDGQRLGIEGVNLATGERRVLARRCPPSDPQGNVFASNHVADDADAAQETLAGDFSGPRVGVYRFDPEALRWGQEAVARAVAVGCDLLIVDEIGRLELEQNRGFSHVLSLLETSIVLRSLLVVRLELLQQFHLRLPDLAFITFAVSDDNRSTLPLKIADRLFLE